MAKSIIRYRDDKRNGATTLKEDKGWSAEDLALIAAALVLLGDFQAFLGLLKERREKSNKKAADTLSAASHYLSNCNLSM
jgi:hypothetical protein